MTFNKYGVLQMRKALHFDISRDSPVKIIACLCIPLSAVYLLSCLTTSFTNVLYSKYVKEYFEVAGLISTAVTSFSMITCGVASAAWIKTAFFYKSDNCHRKNFLANALYSILFTDIMLIAIFLIFKNAVFRLFNIPNELYESVNNYYIVSIFAYVFTSVATYLINCINGIGSVFEILVANTINSCGTAVSAIILFSVFNAGIAGAALVTPVCSVFVVLYGAILLKRKKIPIKFNRDNWRPDQSMIFNILKLGILMSSQCLFCQVGDICLSLQTNKYLSLNYISVLTVIIPLTSVFSSFSSAINAFVPINYQLGKTVRVKKFINTLIIAALIYSALCTTIYATLGKWYYSTLFDDPKVIALGAEYWRIYSIGTVPLCLIYVFKYFFDCIGYNKLAFLSGPMQMAGALFGSYVLIPIFGNSGRSWGIVFEYLTAATYLIISYSVLYRKIYYKKGDCYENN